MGLKEVEAASGLSSFVIDALNSVFARYPDIDEVLLFGSRARGDFTSGSDIDLAVVAPSMTDQRFSELWNELDDQPIAFKMDIIHLDALGNDELKRQIIATVKRLYPSDR